MIDLTTLTIDAARSAVAEGRISATALTQAYFTKIESDDPKIGAFLMLAKERGLAKANDQTISQSPWAL